MCIVIKRDAYQNDEKNYMLYDSARNSKILKEWFYITKLWVKKTWRCRVSNPVPPACKAGALPFELHPHLIIVENILIIFVLK
jgi:hypothetical protein